MARISLKRLAVLCAVIAVLFGPAVWMGPAEAQADEAAATSPRNRAPLTILQINDVYVTQPVDGQGGVARIATLKQRLTAAGRTPLLMIAGDFLSPSVASSVFQGEQMIAAFNAMGMDFATFGNHEFDFNKDVLLKRMAESKFQWIAANVLDTATGKPLGSAKPYVIRTFGTLKVGFIGLCLTTGEIAPEKAKGIRLTDPTQAVAKYLPLMKRDGATVIVALTHLTFAQDRALAETFPQIDIIVGGHEHYPITQTENRTLISKAGQDGRFVARIDVNRRPNGAVERFYELVPITSALPDEPRTAEVVKSYEDRLGKELDAVVGTSTVDLDAVSIRMRSSETNLGDLVADAVRADTNADAAILNAGSIRGDKIYPAGPLTRRTVVAIHPFGNVVCVVEVPGRVLLQALNSGVSKLPVNAGQFPQVSGVAMTVDPRAAAGSRVRDVHVNGQPLDLAKKYRVAIADFMLTGGDEYSMFANQTVLVGPQSGGLLVTALEKYIAAKGTVSPAIDGRITVLH